MSSTFSNFFAGQPGILRFVFSCCHSHNVSQQTGHKKDSRLDCHPYVSALPIFPGRRQPSIFGASELNCRVRNGYGWTLTAISTDYSIPQNLASMDKPTRCLSMETKKQRRERAFTLAWKRAIRSLLLSGDPYESRTRVCGVRGRRLNHLTNGPSSSQASYPLLPSADESSVITLLLLFQSNPLRWALIGVLRTLLGSHLGASPTQVGVVHLQGLEPWTP